MDGRPVMKVIGLIFLPILVPPFLKKYKKLHSPYIYPPTLLAFNFLKILPILHLWVKGPGKTTDDLRMVRGSDHGCRWSAPGRFADDLTGFHVHVIEGHKLHQKTVFIS